MIELIETGVRLQVTSVGGAQTELCVIQYAPQGDRAGDQHCPLFAIESSYLEQAAAPVVTPYGDGVGRFADSGVDDGHERTADYLKRHGPKDAGGHHPDVPLGRWIGAAALGEQCGYWEFVSKTLNQTGDSK